MELHGTTWNYVWDDARALAGGVPDLRQPCSRATLDPMLYPDLDLAALCRAEERRVALNAAQGPGDALEVGGGAALFLGRDAPENFAVGVGLSEPVSEEDLARLEAFYAERSAPPTIVATTHTHPSFLSQLAQRSYVTRAFMTSLAISLERPMAPEQPAAFRIARVDPEDTELAGAYNQLLQDEALPNARSESLTQAIFRTIQSGALQAFVVTVHGELAGGAATDGVSLFGTVVRPAFRRRGIQRALMVHRLNHVLAQGSSLAFVNAVPGIATERTARNLGFEMVYARAVLSRNNQAG